MRDRLEIYQGFEPSEIPRYSIPEAAHYLRLSASTLGSWIRGRSYPVTEGERFFTPLIRRPSADDSRLSFANLVEAYVLRALRASFGVRMSAVRIALEHAEEQYSIDRLFLSAELRAAPGSVFLKRYQEALVDLGRRGQHAMPEVLDAYLQRLVYLDGRALKLYPIARVDGHLGPKIVSIDPLVSFGRPVVEPRGIKTSSIAERFDVGESVRDIAKDYDLRTSQIEEAIRYERWSEKAA